MIRSSVDLPLPLGPSSAVSAPSGTVMLTSSSATKSPKRLLDVANLDGHQSALLSVRAAGEQVHRQQRPERQQGEHDGGRVGAGRVEVLEAILHV